MKKFTAIAVVVCLLLGASIYYSNQQQGPTPEPVPPTPETPVTGVVGAHKMSDVSKGTLTLKSAMSHGYMARGSQDVYATIDVTALEHKGGKRPPMNISLVIDRSGSMTGDKIVQARSAAKHLVGLMGSADRLSIISYASDVTVDVPSMHMTPSSKYRMLRAIDGISVGGGTNLSGGYEFGLREAKNNKMGDSVNRVILVSDGQASDGITHLPTLENLSARGLGQGVSLTTMGVGLDYNEDLMMRMSTKGAGNYYFIEDASSINSVFGKELEGLKSTVAQNTMLTISLAPGVRLAKLYGFAHSQSGQDLTIPLDALYSKQEKNMLMKLMVTGATDGKRPVFSARLTYRDTIADKLSTQANSVHGVVTQDNAKVEEGVNVAVISRVQQVEVAQSMQDAVKLYEQGNVKQAEEVLGGVQSQIVTRQRKYKAMAKDTSFGRVSREMQDMKKTMNAAPASSSAGKRFRKSNKARSRSIAIETKSF